MKRFLTIAAAVLMAGSFAYPMARKPLKNEAISQGVYGTESAIQKGRIDVAEKIIGDTTKLVAPPKKPLDISPAKYKDGKQTRTAVVLPENLGGKVIRVNSAEYQELQKSRQFVKSYQEGEMRWQKYSENVNRALQDNVKQEAIIRHDLEKAEKTIQKKNQKIDSLVKYRNIVFGVIGGFGLLIAVVVGIYILRVVIAIARAAR